MTAYDEEERDRRAAMLLELGVPIVIVSEQLEISLAETVARYGHLVPDSAGRPA